MSVPLTRRAIANTAAALLFAFGICFGQAASADDPPLKSYPVDPKLVSVAGISSGAFMASQIQIAHSAGIKGAALIAGGLYGCAVFNVSEDGVDGKLAMAAGECMNVEAALQRTEIYLQTAKKIKEQDDWIDPFVNLKSKSSKVYLFTGGADEVVLSPVVRRARDLYEALGVPEDQIKLVDKVPPPTGAGHSWVIARAITTDCCNECNANKKPFIDKCDYDQARDELEWIYGGPLEPPAPALKGRLVSFDQTAFVKDHDPKANGLADTGYLFVPKECEPGSAPPLCKLQVVLHGCLQSAESFPQGNDTFIQNIGVNQLADTNRIVVLYPQTHATKVAELGEQLLRDNGSWSIFKTNPGDCWNFWGYGGDGGDKMFPTKKGVQVSAIWQMIQTIIGQANN